MLSLISNLTQRNRLIFDLSIILWLSILVVLPIFIYGIPGGPDMPQHVQFAQTFYDSLKNGVFYPSWAHLPNFGYGDVGIRFYPPLTYYVLSFFRWLSGDWFDATCLTFTLLFFISGLGVYLWSREWFSANASLVGALAYLVLPYHINEIYQASFIAEFTGAAVIPFCFLYANRVCQKGRLIDVAGLALSFGLLILSHLPIAVMASLSLLIYSLFSLRKTNFFSTIFKLSISVVISLLLSSFYWVRMVSELDFVKHTSETFSNDYYSYKSHFIFSFLFPFADIKPSDSASFLNILVLVTLGVLIPSLVLYLVNVRKKTFPSITKVVVVTIFAFMMSTPLSLKIWENFSLLQKIQFPWRWTILVSLGCAVIVASSFDLVLGYFKTSRRYLSLVTLGLLLICIPFNLTHIMNHLFYYPKDYFNTMAEGLKASPSWECWWTTWTQKAGEGTRVGLPIPEFIPGKVVIENRTIDLGNWTATERTFKISAGENGLVTVATAYYPHWKATVNGQSAEVSPTHSGLISLSIPAEESNVRLYFQEPPRVYAAFYISGGAWIIIFGFLLFNLFRSLPNQKNT